MIWHRLAVAGLLWVATPAQSGQLLSIVDLDLAPNEFAWGFEVRAEGLIVRAVCRVPYDWSISATSAVIESQLVGQARHGTSAVHRQSRDRLDRLFLFDDPPAGTPTLMQGTIQVGAYGVDEDPKERPLAAANFHLQPADRCP